MYHIAQYPAWSPAGSLLGRRGKGHPCCANISPQTQKQKNGEIWPSKLNLFLFFCPYYHLPAIYLFQPLNTAEKLIWNMVADSSLLWMFLTYTNDLTMVREVCNPVTSLHTHTHAPPTNQHTSLSSQASNSFNKTKPFIPQLEIRQTTLGGGTIGLNTQESCCGIPSGKSPWGLKTVWHLIVKILSSHWKQMKLIGWNMCLLFLSKACMNLCVLSQNIGKIPVPYICIKGQEHLQIPYFI